MKVVSYSRVVPSKNNSNEKTQLLTKFIEGVNTTEDVGKVYDGIKIRNCDVAVIQGWVNENVHDKLSPNIQLRKNIIEKQRERDRHVVTADSNLFLYAVGKENEPHHYLRYSFDGIFPSTGNYCDDQPDPTRWQKISKNLNIQTEDYKTMGKNIVLCCQRNGGWSMGRKSTISWIGETVKKIREHSDRTIIIRGHPGDKKAHLYLKDVSLLLPNTKISLGVPLEEDLKKAWAVVNHNSSSIVGPIIQGYHGFITDPENSQCKEVTHHDFSHIENPQEFDRQRWLERISMFHWNFEELENGECWRHMRKYLTDF